jgi:acetate kinase
VFEGNENAEMALDIYAYNVSKYIGAYTAVLGGIDALIFTGGIGENSPGVRHRICQKLAFLGIDLNDGINFDLEPNIEIKISKESAPVQVWVIPTNEELQIARNAYSVLTSFKPYSINT